MNNEQHTPKSWFEKCSLAFYPAGIDYRGKLLVALGNVKGKRILELGCGNGKLTAILASKGANILAIDISPIAVKETQKSCKEFIRKVDVQQADANNLPHITKSFDLVVGEFILHHLDYNKTVMGIYQVLKPDGRAIFIEPLAHNPLLNLWRKLTPRLRTPGEHPLSYANIREMGSCFNSIKYQEFGFLPLLNPLMFFSCSIKGGQKFLQRSIKTRSGKLLDKLDTPFLGLCKPLRRYSSAILIEFIKEDIQ